MWQDWVLTATQLVFILALFPTLLHPTKKPTLSTSLMTAPTIGVVMCVYVSLHLWASAVGAFVLFCEWTALGVQRWLLDQREKTSE